MAPYLGRWNRRDLFGATQDFNDHLFLALRTNTVLHREPHRRYNELRFVLLPEEHRGYSRLVVIAVAFFLLAQHKVKAGLDVRGIT